MSHIEPIPVLSAGSAARAPSFAAAPAFVALFVFATVLFAPQVLNDGDTWWHLAAGEWILTHGAIPHTDPFSYTMAGQPWTAHEWLSEVLLALAHRAAGWCGVMLLAATAAAGAVLILGRRLARDLSGTALLIVLVLATSLFAAGMVARPHVLALPIVAAWAAGLMAAREEGRAPSWLLVPLMALWANMHGGFAFGLVLIAPFALEALLAAPAAGRMDVVKRWGAFGIASLAAALVTPHGVGGLLFPLKLIGMSSLGASVIEWQSADFSKFEPLELALLCLIAFALLRPVKMPVLRLILLIGLVHLSLQHVRHQMLLGVVAPMLLAAPIAAAIGQSAIRSATSSKIWLGAAACVLLLIGARIAMPMERLDSANAPIAALATVPQALRAAPVLNAYEFGGYLIGAGVRPYIDGRTDMYGDAFMANYDRITAPDRDALEAALSHYDVSWTMFAPAQPVVSVLDHLPGWQRLYADDFAVIHVRTTQGQVRP